jgi:DNA-binding transcriptional LysR family regulator
VHVVEANTAELQFQELRERKVDVMFGRISGELDDEFAIETLYREPIVVAAGRNHRLADREHLELPELIDEAWILAPPNTVVRDLVGAAFRAHDLPPPRVAVTTYSMQLRMQLLATGQHLSSVPASLLRYNAERWSLCALPVTLGHPLPVVAITLKNRTLSPAVQVFIETARRVAAEMS